MSIIPKKKYRGNVLSRYLNKMLTTNNFSLKLSVDSIVNPRISYNSNQHSLDYWRNTHLTCCSLSEDDCNFYGNYCRWNDYGNYCNAWGENADSCAEHNESCCGGVIDDLSRRTSGQSSDDGSLETRSLSDSISPDMVYPGDGFNMSNSNWWKETSNWILRGNKNVTNNYDPVPCAIPPVYSYATDSYTCGLYLQKVLSDGNDLITMADWSAQLCEWSPGGYCSANVSTECPAAGGVGDMNNDGTVNILDIQLTVAWILGNVTTADILTDYGISNPVACCGTGGGNTDYCNVLDVVQMCYMILLGGTAQNNIEEQVIEHILNMIEDHLYSTDDSQTASQSETFLFHRINQAALRYIAQSNQQTHLSPF